MELMKEWLIALLNSSFLGFDNMVYISKTVLSTGFDSLWFDVVSLSSVLKPFCYVIISICLLLELAQVAAKVDVIKFEVGIKLCIKMVLAKVCIDIAPLFLLACYKQAAAWINLIGSSSTPSFGDTILSDGKVEILVNGVTGMWAVIPMFITLSIVLIAIYGCGIAIQVIAFGRMFELFVYLAVSPFACAFFPLGNGDGGGFSRITGKFFKSFVAVCLQGVMILICIKIFNIIMAGVINEGIAQAVSSTGAIAVQELCITMLLSSIVLVTSIAKCGSWAKSILDAM